MLILAFRSDRQAQDGIGMGEWEKATGEQANENATSLQQDSDHVRVLFLVAYLGGNSKLICLMIAGMTVSQVYDRRTPAIVRQTQ